jgi:D-glycero-beta-D-manno-heptose-7-phosphate kinase
MHSLDRLRDVTVLAVGDIMLDEYIWGDVRRISPEAPVPVVEVRRRTRAPGGAGNVAAGIVAFGGRAVIQGVIGEDAAAEGVRGSLRALGVSTEGVVVDGSRPTTCKTRVIAHAQQVVRTDDEQRGAFAYRIEDLLLSRITQHLPAADAVVLSDYDKGVLSARVSHEVIAAAAQAGKPVVVDPKGREYAKYRGATVLTPNTLDAGTAAAVTIEGEEDLLTAVERLGEVLEGSALLITQGADGMTLFAGGEPFHVPTRAREVYDVTGAGDTVVAMLAIALGCGIDLREAVELANAAAGLAVAKVGTSTVTLEELQSALAG